MTPASSSQLTRVILAIVVASSLPASVHAGPDLVSAWLESREARATQLDASPSKPEVARPRYKLQRWEEDWGVLARGTFAEYDTYNDLKYIPLEEAGDSAYLSLGGNARARLEHIDDFAFGLGSDDADTFLLWHVFLHGDLHFNDNVRVFGQIKHAYSTDRDLPGGNRDLDRDTLALEQLFVDYSIDDDNNRRWTLRVGRQQLAFGAQRLISPLWWVNTFRRWDGVRANLESDLVTASAFWTQFVPVEQFEFNDPDHDNQLYGIYATWNTEESALGLPGNLDTYVLGTARSRVAFNGTGGGEDRYTFGTRWFGDRSPYDWDIEVAGQLGRVGGGDVGAWMFGSEFGMRPLEYDDLGTRLFIGFDGGSGDRRAGGNVQTFHQLFPLGHLHLGFVDEIGRQNTLSTKAGFSVDPTDRLQVRFAAHSFWREESADGVYNAGGIQTIAGSAGNDLHVGVEFDTTVRFQVDRHLSWEAGYSHLFEGAFVRQAGSDDDVEFFYLSVDYVF